MPPHLPPGALHAAAGASRPAGRRRAPSRRRYEQLVRAPWSAVDANAHLRNAGYLDIAADVRFRYFADHGFPPAEFARLAIGPVVRHDDLRYFREVRLLDEVTVTLARAALSRDGARYTLVNEFWRDGTLLARVRSAGGWLDLVARRLVAPPPALHAALRRVPAFGAPRAAPPA